MMMCPVRRLSSALQGGFLLRILQSSWSKELYLALYSSYNPGPRGQNTLNKNKLCILTTFSARYCVLALLSFRTVFQPPVSRFERRYSLTHLVKVEIVSPYCGILINTAVGNPTAPWNVSNVSIIFNCSMLLYYMFWMFNGLYDALLYYFWD